MKLTKAMKDLMARENAVVMRWIGAAILCDGAKQMGADPAIVARFVAIAERYRQEDDALIEELDAIAEELGVVR